MESYSTGSVATASDRSQSGRQKKREAVRGKFRDRLVARSPLALSCTTLVTRPGALCLMAGFSIETGRKAIERRSFVRVTYITT
jgi:hypothetical protein